MWLMARELQGTHVGLLVPCPSSAANKNKVRPVWQYSYTVGVIVYNHLPIDSFTAKMGREDHGHPTTFYVVIFHLDHLISLYGV